MPPEFMLDPDADKPERSYRPVRLVSTGLAPTADVPPRGRGKLAVDPCYVPCSACHAMVLHGRTDAGTTLALDVSIPTYAVVWHTGAPQPTLHLSRSYPVHQCIQEEPQHD